MQLRSRIMDDVLRKATEQNVSDRESADSALPAETLAYHTYMRPTVRNRTLSRIALSHVGFCCQRIELPGFNGGREWNRVDWPAAAGRDDCSRGEHDLRAGAQSPPRKLHRRPPMSNQRGHTAEHLACVARA
jgi:hypothetical protein